MIHYCLQLGYLEHKRKRVRAVKDIRNVAILTLSKESQCLLNVTSRFHLNVKFEYFATTVRLSFHIIVIGHVSQVFLLIFCSPIIAPSLQIIDQLWVWLMRFTEKEIVCLTMELLLGICGPCEGV